MLLVPCGVDSTTQPPASPVPSSSLKIDSLKIEDFSKYQDAEFLPGWEDFPPIEEVYPPYSLEDYLEGYRIRNANRYLVFARLCVDPSE